MNKSIKIGILYSILLFSLTARAQPENRFLKRMNWNDSANNRINAAGIKRLETFARTNINRILLTGMDKKTRQAYALWLARKWNKQVYYVDLGQVVSKYIGETEKNISSVFDAAEASNSVLLFDEADALFGKSSDTRNPGDRYANQETAYLLKRMENHEGIVILASNFNRNSDSTISRVFTAHISTQ